MCNLDGITDTSTPTTADCECELKLELFTGIDFGPQLKVLGLDCAKIDLDLVVGIKVTASDTLFDVGTKVTHLCTGCVSGKLYGEFSFFIKVVFKISDILDLSLTPVSFTKDFYIFQFYWSQTFSDFGYSFSTDKLECPHVAYHTTAYVYDSDQNLAENVAITLYKNGSTEAIDFGTTDSSGTVTGYLETGTYKWETNGCTGTFTIKEDYNTVMIMLTEPEEDDAEEDDSGTGDDDTGNVEDGTSEDGGDSGDSSSNGDDSTSSNEDDSTPDQVKEKPPLHTRTKQPSWWTAALAETMCTGSFTRAAHFTFTAVG
ncbi:MAG: hypothetical protein LUE31_08790, partial [Lachnospiraceae bacterium]|nr:hypothetical protein [Lachnospiraceae bacterium]